MASKKPPFVGLSRTLVKGNNSVKFGSYISGIKTITTGVSQGSNLGSLLFLLYINDLPNCLKSSVPALFANDTNLSVRGATAGDIEEKLESDLNNVHNWLLANKL